MESVLEGSVSALKDSQENHAKSNVPMTVLNVKPSPYVQNVSPVITFNFPHHPEPAWTVQSFVQHVSKAIVFLVSKVFL
jgi:hypothetical protein